MNLTRRGFLTGLGAMFAAATMTQLGGCTYIALGSGRMVSAGGHIAHGVTREGQTLGELLEELVATEDLDKIRGLACAECDALEGIEQLDRDTPLPGGLEVSFRYPRATKITVAGDEFAGMTVGEARRAYGDNLVIINSGQVLDLTDDELIYVDDWLCIDPAAPSYSAAA